MASLQLLLYCAAVSTLWMCQALELTPELLNAATAAAAKAKTHYTSFPPIGLDVDDEVDAIELQSEEQADAFELPPPLPAGKHYMQPPAWAHKALLPTHKHSYGSCVYQKTVQLAGTCKPMSGGIGSYCEFENDWELYDGPHCTRLH